MMQHLFLFLFCLFFFFFAYNSCLPLFSKCLNTSTPSSDGDGPMMAITAAPLRNDDDGQLPVVVVVVLLLLLAAVVVVVSMAMESRLFLLDVRLRCWLKFTDVDVDVVVELLWLELRPAEMARGFVALLAILSRFTGDLDRFPVSVSLLLWPVMVISWTMAMDEEEGVTPPLPPSDRVVLVVPSSAEVLLLPLPTVDAGFRKRLMETPWMM